MPAKAVTIDIPSKPMFVGTYLRLRVRVASSFVAGIDDLDFSVAEGPVAGQISASREPDFDPLKPTIMLLIGSQPGKYHIRVTSKRTGALVSEEPFTVTSLWNQRDAGPSLWFAGKIDSYGAGFWGGGPGGPQNISVFPAPPIWRVALVMVDFSDQRFPVDPATIQSYRDDWYKKVISGYYLNPLYGDFSVRNYYREVSYNRFDLQMNQADIFGPVNLAHKWTDYFSQASGGQWLPRDWQPLVTEIQSVVDFHNYDTVVIASQYSAGQPGDVVPAYERGGWPYATIGKYPVVITSDGTSTTLQVGLISITNHYLAPGSFVALPHELGHNLRLSDQVYNVPAGRGAGAWDLMGVGVPDLPQLSLPHKMMLGWVDATQIETFDFATSVAPQNRLVTLSPAELPTPPGGKVGIEVRVADGLNYYFEYRVAQAAQVSDKGLGFYARNNVVLGTDFASSPNTSQRPWLLTLSGAQTGLDNGEHYEETSVTNITWPGTLRAEVSGITGANADVRIIFGVNGKPDPAIRPWPASASRPWQSPDIEVQNTRNLADPVNWFNVPWEAHSNTVIARITNRGNIDAPGVVADFFVKDFDLANAPETRLGSPGGVQNDVPAGQTVEFTQTWNPPDQGHYCIIVRIRPYQITSVTPVIDELTTLNNEAQSNYIRYISKSMSPAQRVVTSVRVDNPYQEATRVFICPGQTNPLYRTYLQNKWVELEPGESRQIEIMFEYGPVGDRDADMQFGLGNLGEYRAVPNNVSIAGLFQHPQSPDTLIPSNGVQVQVVTGKSTSFDGVRVGKTYARGRVRETRGRDPVPGGKVIITSRRGRGRSRREIGTVTVGIARGGVFRAPIAETYDQVEMYYVPVKGYADCYATINAKPQDAPAKRPQSKAMKSKTRR